MVSKNNFQQHQQAVADRVPHYGLRKLSIGVASVLLSTTLYMGVTAHADTTVSTSPQPTVDQPANTTTGTSTSDVTADAQPTAGQPASTATPKNEASAKAVPTVLPKQPADTTDGQPTAVTSGSQPATNSAVEPKPNNNDSAPKRETVQPSAIKPTEQSTDPATLMTSFAVTEQPVDNTHNPATTTLTSKFTWAIHYTDDTGKKLLPDSVITHDYTRTDTGDQMGNWSYVPDSVKVTGTPNVGWHIGNPDFKFDQAAGGTTFDYASWNASAASIDGYTPNYGSVVLTDQLPKNPESLHAIATVDSGTHEFTFVYTKQPTKVTINYVDDEQGEKVVGTGTVSGKTGTEVTITPQLPKGYMLTPNKDVPSTYTVTDAADQAVTIHVQKQFVDLSNTDPQAKQTRTITLHYVYGAGDKQGQPAFDDAVLDVYYHRTATLDRAINQTTYGDWMWDKSQGDPSTPGYHVVSGKWINLPQTWANVTADVPSIKGYYADLGQNDPTNTNHVPSNTWVFPTYNNSLGSGISEGGKGATAYLDGYGYEVSPTHTVKYMPNQTTITVNYVDDDNNKAVVGSQHWDGTIGQHIDLTLTPPDNYVLTPGWVNPTSYDFDGVNSSWYTVHVKHKTQDVTDQEPKDQVTKVTRLTRNNLYGDGPHKGEKFAEPDIFDLAWKRTATKDLVTNKVTFGDWQVDRDNSKNVQGLLNLNDDNSVGGGLHSGQNGYSYFGQNTHQEFISTDGSTITGGNLYWGWFSDQALKYPTLNIYYGREQVNIPVYYIDADTGQKVAEKINGNALTGNDFRDGNTVTIDQSKLTSLPTTLTDYQLLPGQTFPTSYKINTFGGVKGINVQVVKDRSVKVTFVDDDAEGDVVGTPTTITGHTGGDPVTSNLTVPDKYELADGQQLPTSYTFTKGSGDLTIHLVHQEHSVTVKFVDDQSYEQQVGQAVTLTGRNGDTADLNLTVPDKYQLADGQQLPTTYTFTKGSGDVTIHLVHQIVQREATIDFQLQLITFVDFGDNSYEPDVITQAQWAQLKEEEEAKDGSVLLGDETPRAEVGTLKGHVDYDLVDEEVVSFGDDWTSLNLGGRTYQLPNGTDVVNGILIDSDDTMGKKLKEYYLNEYQNWDSNKHVDPDYANRPWHGYLSVNATNSTQTPGADDVIRSGLQAGLAGDESNTLAKATGDRAATAVELVNKTIDVSWLQDNLDFRESDFREKDGQLKAKTGWSAFGVYIPYVEKTATRTINVTTPDGKTTTVKQTATLAKQIDFGKDVHPDWTTGEWSSYEVPTIPGYTASQTNVAKETVTGTTKDQTVNIAYTANSQTTHINYVDAQGKLVHTTTVNGQTGQTVDVPSEVPTGWKLVDGQTVPNMITFGPDGHADTSVKIEHRHVTVTPDKPQTNGTKLPDNPAQSFHGVEASDLNKTTTRTVKVTTPDGQTKTVAQTVKLTRTATVDEVTGDVTYSNWSTGEWDAYTVPTVKGYTATRTEVAAIPVNDRTTDQTVNVTYTPDAQKLNVKFIDDTTGQVLKTVAKTGVTNTNAGYNTQSDIQSYEGQHYVLVSDSSNGVNLVFDNNDSTDQAYEVHLKHGTHQIDEHHTITQTVHYIATDHAGVPDDHTASVQFDRDGYHDEVTGQDHWNAWKQGGTQTFSAVPTPAKTGYTPDIETISAVTVKPTDPDQKTTVTYTPDTQKLDIVFIDDTTGKTLKTVAKSGPTNSNVGYNTKSDINSYEGQHYVLVSDSSNGASLAFDDQTGIDQHYEVHLKHGTHQVSDRRIITETVHYKMADGTQAPEDHTANVQFDRTGSHDEVTGVDTWNAWTPSATQQFAAVPSPAVSGYTPDTDQVAAQTVGPDAKDAAVTVTYSPNVQIAHVKYVDDTDHKVLTQDDLNGRTGETSGYHTADRITEFKGQRYKFVSDNYPVDGMTFDNNDHVDQQYEVHLVHDTRTDEQDVNVPRTITYVYQSGQQAQPDHTDSLKFHETKVVDLVDGHTVSDAWTQAQDFETVTTPTIQGYTPDRASVSNIGITHGHPAITEKVTYNPDAQKAVVKYIDDTTGEQLSAKDLSGYSDESTGYTTKDAIDGYTAKRYVLVSDGTQGQTIAFDHDDSADQVYEVHFKHGTEPTSESRTKKIVVHYSYVDGLARTGKAADDQIATDLTFSRTGTRDLVTDHIAWNAWDKSSQTFDAINSPAIQGYTPDRTVIDNVKVNPDSHDLTEVTVTYNADSQKLSVDFIDDTTGKTLKTINKIGYSDENAGYNTKSDIQDFISKHYDLISDQTNGENLVFDHDDKTDQQYEVHLTHHLAPITDSREVNKTIHYQYADGAARNGKAADDYNAQALNFSRTGNHDDVTGIDHWNAWTPASQNFNEVQSPVIAGYTPDKSVIDQQAVNAESPNIDLTVTYAPDAQKLDVVYIDDTEGGKVLKTVTKNGVSDEAAGYNTKSDINALEGLHYNVVSDSTNGANLVFDHDDATDQHYEVHLTHATKPISEAKSTNETIRYQLADGTKAFDDYTAKVNFSRTGFNDLVTNIDHWNDWTPAVEQNFNAIQSPVKQGYTPDHAQIDAITVHPGDADTARTVIYSPDAQTVTIDYLDDVTGKTLQTKTITGVSDVDTGYTTAETINNYEGQHYKLVSDNTNGDQLVFDHDDATDQHYEVHLTHTYKSVNDSATVNEAIHYQYADGTQAKPDHKAEALNFSRTGTQDLVDNSITWNAWTPDQQTFVGVDTPAIGGYTPDIETIAPVTVSHNTPDVERTVIYHTDDQTILVHYIDDDTQSTLKTDSIIGKTSQKSGYKTGKTIDSYKQAGYDLVSDDTNGDELVFDNDSTKAQVYNVHLKHRHQAASDSDTVKQTVHYVYNDGSKAADDYAATPIEFTRTGDTDLVTGKTTWNAWTPTSQTFKAVPSPVIAGYTPGRATIDHIDVHAGDPDIDETVTYVPDAQRIVVNYIDSVTHQTLKTDTLDGRSDQSTNYNTQKNIDGYKNQHYTLVSDDTQGQNLVFDHDDQATQVYNVVLGHETETVHRAHTVSETIDYKYADGTEAAPTKTAESKTFSQSGVHDLVTNTTDWNGQWTAPQTFNAVDSPQITGFTPDHASIDAVTVDHDSQDVHKLVVYTANKQAAKINYIDDVTGETLETDTAAGHFGEQISFGRDVNDQIKQFENQGYKLASNNFNGQKYQADDNDNVFDVHLTHQHQAVSEPDTVTETVKYQYADGTQAAKDSTQSAEFTRTGDKDLVTGTIVWMPSTETHQFDAVDSPAIDGFTPDVQSVPAATVKFGDRDITKVATYTANDQNAGIKIIDDTTGDVLNTQTATGKFGQTIEFKIDPNSQVTDLQGQGYELVSDNFSQQKYQSDNAKNQFEIHVRHQTAPVTRTSTVTETVHYHDRNGHQLVPDTHATKTFTETGVTDKVTGKTTWTPTGTQTFDSVKVPTVTGCTPDRTEVPSIDVHFGDHNIDETVIYTPDSETAQIKYIDDITGEVLLTDNTSGDYGSTIEFDHNPSSQINQYESQGYKLVSNSYGDQTHQFSATPSDNQFEVHLTHQTKDVSRTKTVTRTINYVDAQTGNKLRPSDQQTLTFTEHGIMDLVTGKTTWVTAPVQHFAKVVVPDIDGYTHQMQTVDSQTADFDSDDFEVTVPYTKVQTPNVPDTGTPTGSQSTPGTVTPTGGEDIPTGTQTINGQRQVISTADEPQHQPVQNNSQAQTLPRTGNSEQNGTALACLGLIGMVGSLFGFKKKRD